jgi:diguanylate cyclase (GGDEF)-like protein
VRGGPQEEVDHDQQGLAAQAREIVELRARLRRAEEEATVDPLTGIGNRRAWDRGMAHEEERCRRTGAPATVLVLDLDGLKAVNDRYGHKAGDEMLCRTAAALVGVTRTIDLVARLGGDEFGILAVDCDSAGAALLLDRVQDALRIEQVSATIGIAVRERTGLGNAWVTADADALRAKRSNGYQSTTA